MKSIVIYKYIKIIILLCIIFLVIILFFLGSKVIEEKNTPVYSTVEEIPDVETLINELYGKFIKMKNVNNEEWTVDIYLDLKYGLYEGEKDKMLFISALISDTALKMNYQNYRLIDEEKDIEIQVICDSDNKKVLGSYINGDSNYYGHYESQKALANYEKKEIVQFNIESNEINTLIQNNWNKDKLNIGKAEKKYENYIKYLEYGIKIYELDEKVFNLVFDNTYKSSVVNGIKVGEDLQKIIEILGTPTFGGIEKEYLGYLGQDMYIFFSKNEISIYPVEKSQDINQLIANFEEEKSIKKLVSGTTDLLENYQEYYYDENTVDLSYPLQGLKIQFGVTNDNGIIIYNNYRGKIYEDSTLEELSKQQIEIPSYIYFVDKDYIDEFESNRIYMDYITNEGGDVEYSDAEKYFE